ncbi:MAG: flavin-dependent dehydrogenase [Cyanobacteriota bacterium]|nr:flavin-dependent dehydrogenase [Cyanobacteriota bacterium]
MKEILYLEIPTPDTAAVRLWLQEKFDPPAGEKILTPDGIRLLFDDGPDPSELSIFLWSLQRTTYLKVFSLGASSSMEKQIIKPLTANLRNQFPQQYPEPPEIDLSQESIFDALAPHYPLTVKYFQKMPKGEYDLQRAYWWEKRWREGVQNPQKPKQVIFKKTSEVAGRSSEIEDRKEYEYDSIYIGGALGVVHAAVMARLGYRVLLIERLPFGRMNREWNISRSELESLIDLGLFTAAEIEGLIAREYKDGFNKFFDANNPPFAKAAILHTPTVLNVALDSEKLLHLCGVKLREAGGEIADETEFIRADIEEERAVVEAIHLPTKSVKTFTSRLIVDAMGTASPIAWQLNGTKAFSSVCPTVGAVVDRGFEPGVWDSDYGDVLNSHGDISRGRQLIWELFPGAGNELTIYLFHYHQVNSKNPGSLLEMYEDFFAILPEYRRCNMDDLVFKKPTFGYIPGHFSLGSSDRQVAFDRLICIGDAASLQSPLVFTGFGSLVRNLPRLTELLDTALKHDLLDAKSLNQIRAYQSNISVTWLFSKGMMVPTGKFLPPQKISSILNTFFGILADSPPEVAETFIKDKTHWWMFTGLALKAARKNILLLVWILDFINVKEISMWLISYLNFTFLALMSFFFGWLPNFTRGIQSWLEPRMPRLWLWLLAASYNLTNGMGKPKTKFKIKTPELEIGDRQLTTNG